jgi:NTP pyrophosphatase (non-canonical NTP hydrolase)
MDQNHLSNPPDLANMRVMTGGREMKSSKTINKMQEEVDAYIGQFKEGYFSPLAMMARITEETGELAREINHRYGEKPKKKSEPEKAIEEELGDVLFVLICLANSLGISLEEAHDRVMDKFQTRDKNRWTKKEDS